ncbi:hypothetical protein [Halobacillus campisalis]|uniref:Uncharacterized protein n=1 Tax=Halobacillus campisalis TaxID=435909 RepID=A0ABW2K970_9BACI|nr:hypothetical protein [Halobacillus campisalis]
MISMMMYGDIAIAGLIGSLTAMLSGVGFIIIEKRLKKALQ